MKKIFFILILFIDSVYAQNQSNVWYFGSHAGIDFNSGAAVAITNSAMETYEGCASIADEKGNILFYTDGVTVWDSSHAPMPNGTLLAGGFSSTQSAMIVPFPRSSHLYYIFTVSEEEAIISQLRYSVVNMNLHNGRGNITAKNILVTSPVTEKLTAVKHSNNNDVWVMAHGEGNNSFIAYLVTSAGIIFNPVISNVGMTISNFDTRGYMKFSPDGSKIAFAAVQSNCVALFDFNPTTGIVSNEKILPCPAIGNCYGIEFSQSGKYLYSSLTLQKQIFQWNLSAKSTAAINVSRQLVGTSSASQAQTCALQLGPDGKIYVALRNSGYLAVIHHPDSSGMLCGFADTAIYLGGKYSFAGLPNILPSNFAITGISDFSRVENITVYPNPFTDELVIKNPEFFREDMDIKVSDTYSKEIFKLILNNNNLAYQAGIKIATSQWEPGIYFIEVAAGRERTIIKTIKQ